MALQALASDVALQLSCAALALLLSAHGLRGHRLAPSGLLKRFAVGFGLIGAAQFIAAVLEILTATSAFMAPRQLDHFDVLFWLHYVGWIIGLSLLLSTFDRRKMRLVLALGPVLLIAGPILQVLVIVLLMLVAIHAGLNHIERTNVASRLTTLGYFLALLGHFLFLWEYDPLTPQSARGLIFLAAGLLSLLWAARLSRQEPA